MMQKNDAGAEEKVFVECVCVCGCGWVWICMCVCVCVVRSFVLEMSF